MLQPLRVGNIRGEPGKSFDGFNAFCEGRFEDAATAFSRSLGIGSHTGFGQAWLALTRVRAGWSNEIDALADTPPDTTTGDNRDTAIQVLAGRSKPDSSYISSELCCLSSFAAEHALLNGDERHARGLLEVAAGSGGDKWPEKRAARAALERMKQAESASATA